MTDPLHDMMPEGGAPKMRQRGLASVPGRVVRWWKGAPVKHSIYIALVIIILPHISLPFVFTMLFAIAQDVVSYSIGMVWQTLKAVLFFALPVELAKGMMVILFSAAAFFLLRLPHRFLTGYAARYEKTDPSRAAWFEIAAEAYAAPLIVTAYAFPFFTMTYTASVEPFPAFAKSIVADTREAATIYLYGLVAIALASQVNEYKKHRLRRVIVLSLVFIVWFYFTFTPFADALTFWMGKIDAQTAKQWP